jgi:hypothetical protein
LNLALDPRLRLELDDDARVGTPQYVHVQFCFAWAVTADRIQMHAGLDHLGSQHDRIALICSHGRDNACAVDGVRDRGAANHFQARQVQRGQIAFELRRCSRISVVQLNNADTELVIKGDRLKFALRAIADERHDAAGLSSEPSRSQCRHRGCAKRRR